jgi:Family of unknown function (DUF5329)
MTSQATLCQTLVTAGALRRSRAAALLAPMLCWALAAPAAAAEMTPVALREVSALLERIEKSGCEFNRSGTWYDGAAARKHLQRKYDYLVERKYLGSAEDFVTHAATKSSMSGKPYSIRCAGTAEVPSAQWLDAELRRLRSAPPPAASPSTPK